MSAVNVSGCCKISLLLDCFSMFQDVWHFQLYIYGTRCELDRCPIKLKPEITHDSGDQIQALGPAGDHCRQPKVSDLFHDWTHAVLQACSVDEYLE